MHNSFMKSSKKQSKTGITVESYLQRAENELILARATFDLSTKKEIKEGVGIEEERTFFNNVISQCYYSIFYSAKAYLFTQGYTTTPPNEHRKLYEIFKKLVESKKLHPQLAEIYEEESNKAEVLLNILFTEKRNRGRFTYDINANANLPFAEQSLDNARIFISSMNQLVNSRTF